MRSHYLKLSMRFILWAFRQCYQMMKFHATHWARPVSNLYTGRSWKSSDKILPKKITFMCLILNFLLKPNIILVDCKQNPQRWLHCWVLWELSEHRSRNLSGRKRNRIVRSFCEIICSFYLKKIPLLKASSVNLQAKVTSKWSPRKAPASISTKRPTSCLLFLLLVAFLGGRGKGSVESFSPDLLSLTW